MIDVTQCPWCGSAAIKQGARSVATAPYWSVDVHGELIPVASMSAYSECLACGLLFQSPRCSNEWYQWFYKSGTYRQTLGLSQEVMDADEQRRAENIIEFIKSYSVKPSYHMDIGSSRGFLLQASESAFNCFRTGVDLFKGYAIYKTLTTCGTDKPDLVSAIHVLEHVTDPVKELTTWADMTSNYLLIEVPGMKTQGGPLRFAHLYYFPPELLRDKIIELGFSIMGMETDPNTRILARKISQNTV